MHYEFSSTIHIPEVPPAGKPLGGTVPLGVKICFEAGEMSARKMAEKAISDLRALELDAQIRSDGSHIYPAGHNPERLTTQLGEELRLLEIGEVVRPTDLILHPGGWQPIGGTFRSDGKETVGQPLAAGVRRSIARAKW